jgi:hypothetical protein
VEDLAGQDPFRLPSLVTSLLIGVIVHGKRLSNFLNDSYYLVNFSSSQFDYFIRGQIGLLFDWIFYPNSTELSISSAVTLLSFVIIINIH